MLIMTVPLLNLQAQYRSLQSELDAALLRVAESQVCILGSEVDALEHTLAQYSEVRFALGISSGTDALLMALMALEITQGDEVIVPTYSFFATAGAVARLGATPVFVDSEPHGFNIDPNLVEQAITPRTKAIIPVHLFGQTAAMDALLEIAERHGVPLIEDAAQAIGSEYRSRRKDTKKAGSFGIMGCFSFYPTKNLGAFGDAGLITTNDEALYTKLKQLRNHGMEPRYYHKFVGGNFRIDAIQAAVLNVKFPHLESWHAARRTNAEHYTHLFVERGLANPAASRKACSGFAECPHCATSHPSRFDADSVIVLPEALHQASGVQNYHIYNQYNIRAPKRDALRAWLAERGIGTEIYYPVPFHRQECFSNIQSNDADFPVANCLAAHSLALPIYPELRSEQREYVVDMIAAFYNQG
jgi:dTDP-4-amino-4,6-dideoxygalactose transaminase